MMRSRRRSIKDLRPSVALVCRVVSREPVSCGLGKRTHPPCMSKDHAIRAGI
ncbi:hypothetical protein PAMC26510_05250 [Caballeronia sordidicola]|uniref:Uncharacterized protein n=1 Tax=Caballeronia sordidicola TaxID=196367 RepID=A0A242N8A0_CABSO|nr:hypothetical protein PAMC26510_05250 [Caballeronia sordidicola]